MKKSELRQIIREIIREQVEGTDLFKNNGRLTPYLSEEDFDNKWKTDDFKNPINDIDNDPLDEECADVHATTKKSKKITKK